MGEMTTAREEAGPAPPYRPGTRSGQGPPAGRSLPRHRAFASASCPDRRRVTCVGFTSPTGTPGCFSPEGRRRVRA